MGPKESVGITVGIIEPGVPALLHSQTTLQPGWTPVCSPVGGKCG